LSRGTIHAGLAKLPDGASEFRDLPAQFRHFPQDIAVHRLHSPDVFRA
jgi:hypothetical protein